MITELIKAETDPNGPALHPSFICRDAGDAVRFSFLKAEMILCDADELRRRKSECYLKFLGYIAAEN